MSAKFIVLGAGGHARVVIDTLRSAGCEILGCLDPKLSRGTNVDGVAVLGGDETLEGHAPDSVALANGVGGANSTDARRALFEPLAAAGYRFPPIKAASAHCAATARLADGCQLLTRAVVHPGASIGKNTVVNTAAVVEHDCIVGDHCFIGPGAILCGDARLGDGAFIGAGAVVLPGINVGAGAHVAAGAVVHKDLPAGGKARGGSRLFREVAP